MAKIETALARWQRDPESFIAEMIANPETGRPYELLEAERRFLAHCFTADQNGRLQFPEWLYGAPKKSGKTAWAAILTLTATLVYGGRFAESYVCANDLEQAQSRVFAAIRRIVEASPDLRSEAKITQSRIEFPATGAFIQALGADYASAAGANPVLTCFDELWAYTSERSRRLWDEMVPVPTRQFSARLTCTYAGFTGESVLLEELYQRGISQPEFGPDLHAGNGILAFWSHRPIAPWQTEAWIEQMRGQLRPNAFLRMIENRFTSNEESFIDVAWWDECTTVNPVAADKSLPVFIGVDASVKRDSTAIVACTWDRNLNRCRMVTHKTFHPSPDAPLDFENTIEATLRDLKGRFKVKGVLYDPYQMAAVAQRLQSAGLPMQEFPQTVGNLTDASSNLYDLIKARQIAVYPDDEIRLAVQRAVAVEGARGWKLGKQAQTHRIDAVVALSMAALGAVRNQIKAPPKLRIGWGGVQGSNGILWEHEIADRRFAHRIRRVTVAECDIEREGIRLR